MSNKLPSTIEIHIQHTNGSVSKFVQNDAEVIRNFLDNLNPARIFQDPYLIIQGPEQVSVLSCAHMVRLDLVMDVDTGWQHPEMELGDYAGEISSEQFTQQYQTQKDTVFTRSRALKQGDEYHGFIRVELITGTSVIFEVKRKVMPMFDQRSILGRTHEFALFAPRIGGGYVFINLANTTRVELLPGLPEIAPFAWKAAPKPD